MNPSENASADSANNPTNDASVEENNANGTETNSNTRDPKDSAGPSSRRRLWHERREEHRRERNSKRERSYEGAEVRDRDRNPHIRQRENCNEESREECEEQSVQHHCDSRSDLSHVENSQKPLCVSAISNGVRAATLSFQRSIGLTEEMNTNPSGTMNANSPGDVNISASAVMNSFNFMGMPADRNLYGMLEMSYDMINVENMMSPTKEVIHLSKCVLYPPNHKAAPLPTLEKPPGCKTVFVGNLPEAATEEIVIEIFSKCGKILTIRMSKKNFCHIRFATEDCVENAVKFSGYKIKIGNKDDASNNARLHVDYAKSRDDRFEHESRQRFLQREASHHERMDQGLSCSSFLVPPVLHLDPVASTSSENLRNEETFVDDADIPTNFERYECSKSDILNSLPQNSNCHVQYLQDKNEETQGNTDPLHREQLHSISVQHTEIETTRTTTNLQKTQDQCSKSRGANVEGWEVDSGEVVKDRVVDEMHDVSYVEGEQTTNISDEAMLDIFDQPEEINISQRLEVSENESVLVKSEANEDYDSKSRESEGLHENMCDMQQDVQLPIQQKLVDGQLKELQVLKSKFEADTKSGKENGESSAEQDDNLNTKDKTKYLTEHEIDILAFASFLSASSSNSLLSGTSWLVCFIATFLDIHPLGASLDYICSWLHQIDDTIRPPDVENLMQRYPWLFMQECTNIGASFETKWRFCRF